MIDKIVISSRKEMEEFLRNKLEWNGNILKKAPLPKTAIISICSEADNTLMKGTECDDILTLIFEDWTEEDRKKLPPDRILFDEDMARQVISFLDRIKNKEIKTLYIHCDAGVSRSGAVGIFACRYLGMDEKEFRKYNFINPNTLVYDLLYKVSGLRSDYKKFWEKKLKEGELLIPPSNYKIRFVD